MNSFRVFIRKVELFRQRLMPDKIFQQQQKVEYIFQSCKDSSTF